MGNNQAKKALNNIYKWVLYKICDDGGSGDEKKVKRILDEYPSLINEILDSYGSTVLILASRYNHIKVVKLLFSYNNTNINVQDKGGRTPLHHASSKGHKEIVELLLSHKDIDINQQSIDGWTAVHFACYNRNKMTANLLLSDYGADINKQDHDGRTALHFTSEKGHREMVEVLLLCKTVDINLQDKYGRTALHYASYNRKKETAELLISHNNIDINKQNHYGRTALHYASRMGQYEIVEVLLSYYNIEINIQDQDGWTALHYASYNGFEEIAELLLAHNIDFQCKDKKGKLASDVCCDWSRAKKSKKPILLKKLKNHRNTKAALMLSFTMTHSNKGNLPPDNIISQKPQTDSEESKVVDEVKERELLTVVEENESFNLQIQDLEEEMTEITNNNMKEIEKEMDNTSNKNELERILRENNKLMVGKLMKEMKRALNNIEKNQSLRMEYRFEAWKKQMEIKLEEKKRSLVIKSLPLPPNKQTHVFLTHTWRDDEEGRNNHDRVGRVNEALRERGLVTWFDSERMSGTVRQAMTDALDATCCVLIFITKKYEEKVNSKNEADNCYFEFNVAAHNRNLANMRIPIVMEECMLSQAGWQDGGRLMAEVGHQLYFDLSSDEKDVFEERCNEVFVRVVKLLNI